MLGILLACVAASVALVAIGMVLRRKGFLPSRGLAFIWAVLCVVPVFGAGLAMYLNHLEGIATNETEAGVNEPPPGGTIRR